jgi:sugar/nucleoside kinase (ribokinase family)
LVLAENYDKLFVITLGAKGSIGYTKTQTFSAKPVIVEKIIDTTGAGDAFAAMFIKEYLQTKNVEQSLIAGNKHAAKIIQQIGSF